MFTLVLMVLFGLRYKENHDPIKHSWTTSGCEEFTRLHWTKPALYKCNFDFSHLTVRYGHAFRLEYNVKNPSQPS